MNQPYRQTSQAKDLSLADKIRDVTQKIGEAHLERQRALQRRDLAIAAFAAAEEKLAGLTEELHDLAYDEARP